MIQAEEGFVIFLHFLAFDIDFHTECRWDHLTITDGDGTTLMEKNCGSSLPGNITSVSNIVKLHFSTNNYGDGNSGWSVSWSAEIPSECKIST